MVYVKVMRHICYLTLGSPLIDLQISFALPTHNAFGGWETNRGEEKHRTHHGRGTCRLIQVILLFGLKRVKHLYEEKRLGIY